VRLIPRTRGGALWRFLAAAVIVIGFTAATTAVAGLLQVNDIVKDLNLTPAFKNVPVSLPPAGAPQTILVIGSDHRAGTTYASANTDTMMLIRIDDNSSTINLLSIPRDLQVQLPGGTAKLNAAYSEGGVPLLIDTIKKQIFPGIVINHVLDVNFGAFQGMVNAIGCVYTDVDHRYYNNTAQTDYSSIDIQPGYQKLCGDNQADTGALAFVRFRHTDSDIVRNARQQDFIRWAKQNYTGAQVFANRDKLLSIFGRHAQTDNTLHSAVALESLVVLIANGAGHALKSIPFPAQLAPCNSGGQTPCYVTATAAAEASAYRQFITPTQTKPKPATTASPPAGGKRHKHKGGNDMSGLVADPTDGKTQAEDLGRAGFPVYYPKYLVGPDAASTIGSTYCSSITGNCNDGQEPASEYIGSYPRQYVIHAPGGGKYKSYVMTVDLNSSLGYYYTVQGTTWKTPPILKDPTQTQVINRRTLLEYFNGTNKLSLVAWKTPNAVYWISNTLTDYIPPGQMKAMAASLTLGH
jgi:LCP family protein required for cell wall assembly